MGWEAGATAARVGGLFSVSSRLWVGTDGQQSLAAESKFRATS
eukprot:SAG31_NODE_772_length_12197_cov_7.075963_6_plen_43_part_00